MSKEIKMRVSNVERKDQKRCLCVLDIGPKPSISDFIQNTLTKMKCTLVLMAVLKFYIRKPLFI